MKSISKICITLLTIMLTGICNDAFAQDIDSNRMNRDINIMENVLEEMFKTNVKSSANGIRTSSFSIGAGSSNSIRGTHSPDYGIIFSIPGMQRRFLSVNSESDKENGYAYVFEYSDSSGNDEKVTKESIVLRIKEFLREYGSTIGQLQDDDKIMVIYNSNTQNNTVTFFNSSGMKRMSEKLPTISVVITKKDLKEYRSGDIIKSELDERFSVSIVDEGKKETLDLKVMANIFETALKDSGEESFRISGDVDYLKLDNFGAVFSMNSTSGSGIHIIGAGAIEVNLLSSFRTQNAKNYSDSIDVAEVRQKLEELRKERTEKEEAEKAAYQDFLSNIKDYLVDYGRTLTSVSSDQHILISTTISSRVDDIPERVDFQIKKSVLEAMDKGSINRDEAINQITVREY